MRCSLWRRTPPKQHPRCLFEMRCDPRRVFRLRLHATDRAGGLSGVEGELNALYRRFGDGANGLQGAPPPNCGRTPRLQNGFTTTRITMRIIRTVGTSFSIL